jgi:hypothetical protein
LFLVPFPFTERAKLPQVMLAAGASVLDQSGVSPNRHYDPGLSFVALSFAFDESIKSGNALGRIQAWPATKSHSSVPA